jgi:radical SAM superfamily enzyme YgiQ (UPF0313 family)
MLFLRSNACADRSAENSSNHVSAFFLRMIKREHILFRPPAEAHSLIIRIMDGCPWNRCTFCGMYKEVKFRLCSDEEIRQAITNAHREYPQARRIFLADGDVMALSFDKLKSILEQLNRLFPRLARVNVYANGHSILNKTADELRELKAQKLNTLYMGLESGDEKTLQHISKRETADEMIEAGIRARKAGLKMSVMILTGLGGQENKKRHLQATAEALNRMQPRLLSALRVIPIPGTALFKQEQQGDFIQLTELQAVEELRDLIEKLELESTVFRANHSSNILPMEGRFPKDKAELLNHLDSLISSGRLDGKSPGAAPLSL